MPQSRKETSGKEMGKINLFYPFSGSDLSYILSHPEIGWIELIVFSRLREIFEKIAAFKIKKWWIRNFWDLKYPIGMKRLLRSSNDEDYSVW